MISIILPIFRRCALTMALYIELLNPRRLRLVYQPQIESRTNKLVGLEALCRWKLFALWDIDPSELISIAERSHLIKRLDAWSLNESCRQLAIWKKINPESNINISVNFSRLQFSDHSLDKRILKIARSHKISPNQITIELTETCNFPNHDISINTLRQIKNHGFSISLDDFGVGLSNFSCIKHFPLDFIKIDRDFVKNISVNHTNYTICSSIMRVAASKGIEVVAEGVESKADATTLATIGIDILQGYYISLPKDPEEISNQWISKI